MDSVYSNELSVRKIEQKDFQELSDWWQFWWKDDLQYKDMLEPFFGYMVSNYKYKQKDRQYAMDLLITTVEKIAKELGYNYIFTITRNIYVQNKHKKLGWQPAKGPSIELIKKL